MFVYWSNEAKNPFFEANNFKLWVRSPSQLLTKISLMNKFNNFIFNDDIIVKIEK